MRDSGVDGLGHRILNKAGRRRDVQPPMKAATLPVARPEFIKAAPVSTALPSLGHRLRTGPHYHHGMSAVFFGELATPEPDIKLGVGSGSHATQTTLTAWTYSSARRPRPCESSTQGPHRRRAPGRRHDVRRHALRRPGHREVDPPALAVFGTGDAAVRIVEMLAVAVETRAHRR